VVIPEPAPIDNIPAFVIVAPDTVIPEPADSAIDILGSDPAPTLSPVPAVMVIIPVFVIVDPLVVDATDIPLPADSDAEEVEMVATPLTVEALIPVPATTVRMPVLVMATSFRV